MKKLSIFLIVSLLSFSLYGQSTEAIEELADKNYEGANIERNLVYKTVDGIELTMDLVLPKKSIYVDGSPILLHTHGGGWAGGHRYGVGDHKYWTDKGIAVATISYRFAKEKDGKKYTLRDCITDCKDAARFLAWNSGKYDLDPRRMAVFGHSAGGHLSLMTALAPNDFFVGDERLAKFNPKFLCAVGLAPVVSFVDEIPSEKKDNMANSGTRIRLFGADFPESFEEAKACSPMTYFKKDSLPIMLIHGDKDPLVPIETSRFMHEKGREMDADITLLEVKDGDHGMHNKEASPTPAEFRDARNEFILKHLLKNIATPYEIGSIYYKGFNAKRDILYKTVDDINLYMDILIPEVEAPKNGYPIIVFIHGGAWASTNRYSMRDFEYWNKEGIAVAVIDYRVAMPNRYEKRNVYTVRDCLTDCFDASRWLVKNAKEYNLDTTRMATYGESAGGHLSLATVLANQDDFVGNKELSQYRPNFVCGAGIAPVVTLTDKNLSHQLGDRRITGKKFMSPEGIAESIALSPMEMLTENSVPTFIIQGDTDDSIKIEGPRAYYEKAKSLGLDVEYLEVKSANHSMLGEDGKTMFISKDDAIQLQQKSPLFNHLDTSSPLVAFTHSDTALARQIFLTKHLKKK